MYCQHPWDIAPIEDEKETICYTIHDKKIVRINLDHNEQTIVYDLTEIDFISDKSIIQASRNGRYAVITDELGELYNEKPTSSGVLIDLKEQKVIYTFVVNMYHIINNSFAFFSRGSIDYFIFKTEWNRIDILNINENRIVTERVFADHHECFHGHVLISPNEKNILDNAWVWNPVFVLRTWSIDSWLMDSTISENPTFLTSDLNDEACFDYIDDDTILLIATPRCDDEDCMDNHDTQILSIVNICQGDTIARTAEINKYAQMIYDRYLYLYDKESMRIYTIDNMQEIMNHEGPDPIEISLTKIYQNAALTSESIKFYHRGSKKFVGKENKLWSFPSTYSQDFKYLFANPKNIQTIMNCLLMLHARSDGNCFSLLPKELIINDIYKHLW